jgi:hypothetical protein
MEPAAGVEPATYGLRMTIPRTLLNPIEQI